VTTLTPSQPASASQASSAAERWLEGFTEGWRAPRGADAFAEHFRPMLAPDVRLIQPQLPTVTGVRGFEEQFVRPMFALFPDIRGEVERWAAREDVLYIELTLRATLAGRPVSWRACDRVTLKDGLAVERESYFDPAPLLAAIARSPRAWPAFLRAQARSRISQLSKRRKA
jgi:ketosteroid isomerase-like protein